MPQKPFSQVVTLGCRLNKAESDVISDHLEQSVKKNVIVVNTCAVTNEAIRKSRQAIRSLHRTFPKHSIIVTGCAATLEPKTFHAIEGVKALVPNDQKHLQESFLGESCNAKTMIPFPRASKPSVRAFVKVQNGCDHACTFCAITQARGNSNSIPYEHIFKTIKNHIKNGVREIILTGVNITSYRNEISEGASFGLLTLRILKDFPKLSRLSFGSLDPADVIVDDVLINVMTTQKRISPYIHLSLQSGDPVILKRMKRRHHPERVVDLCQELRRKRPDLLFGADMIAGFPTESEMMFQRTLRHIEMLRLHHVHVFPFSPRKSTVASKMPQIEQKMIKLRAKKMRGLAKWLKGQKLQAWCRTKQSILITSPNSGINPYGTVTFIKKSPSHENHIGSIVRVIITSHDGQALFGHLLMKNN